MSNLRGEAPVAQRIERSATNREVGGSNPPGRVPGREIPRAYFQPFPDFEHEALYVQARGHNTFNLEKTRSAVAAATGAVWDDFELTPVWMRWVTGDEAVKASGGQADACWLECERTDAGALPFYRAEQVG